MASPGGGSLSILEYFGGEDGNRCGYCKSEAGNVSHGEELSGWMWSDRCVMSVVRDLS